MISTRSTRSNPTRLLALGVVLLAFALPASADERIASASAFMSKTVDDVLAILEDKKLAPDVRLKKLEDIALERFDFPRMALLVLGKNRRQLDDSQLEQFQLEFRKSLSNTYGKKLDRYTSNEKIEMGETRGESNKDVTVKTRVVGGQAGDGVPIDYRLREIDGGGWLIIDVTPAGVSLIQNFRSQVQEIVTQKGVGALIRTLHEKNESAARQATAGK